MDPSSHFRYQRDSVSTLDSDFSNTSASSISSLARSNSGASTNTDYSDHSLASASSQSSFDLNPRQPPRSTADSRAATYAPYRTASERVHDDPRRAALRAAQQQANLRVEPPVPAPAVSAAPHATPVGGRQVSKVSNKFACSHCSETFGKKSDRRKHWQHRCQYLGDRNTPESSPGDGFVCRACDHVARNGFQQRKHQQSSGHHDSWEPIHLNARERFTCSKHGKIFRSAHEFYAHFDRDGCPLNTHSGGNDGYRHHQTRIITLLEEGRDNLSGNHTYLFAALSTHCYDLGLQEDDWRGIVQRHSANDALALANRLEWGLQRPDGSAISRLGFTDLVDMVSQAVPLHYAFDRPIDLGHAEGFPSELSSARFVRRIEENAAQTAIFRPHCLVETQAEVHSRQQDIGLAMLRPLHRSGSRPPESPYSVPVSNARHGLFGLDHHVEFVAPWLHDTGFTPTKSHQNYGVEAVSHSLPDRCCKEMAVRHDAPSLTLPLPSHVRNPDRYHGRPVDSEYPERAALTPSPPPPTFPLAKKKRPISKNSAVLADSVARSRYGPMQGLVHRPAPTVPAVDRPTLAYLVSPVSSQRSSGDSMGKYFDWKAYEAPPDPTMLLPGTKAANYDDPATMDTTPSYECSRTPGQVIKDKLRKMTDPTPREMDAEAAQELIPIPRNSAGALQCVHCGTIDDIECHTKHIIARQVVPPNRRQASMLDPAEVERALRNYQQENEHWFSSSGDSPSFG